ncbi:hypothetical protein UlMin_008969 [Ulmus minor]
MMAGVRTGVLSDSSSRQIGVRTVAARTPTPRQLERSHERLGVHLVVERPGLTTGLRHRSTSTGYQTELLKRGHLLDLLTDKGKKTVAKRDNHVEEPKEPTPERVINVITGGSEISGISYSAARRHARVSVNPETCSSQPPAGEATDQVISFVDNEATSLINPHHDALVISLLVANCKIKRILVDNGSSTNVLFLNALKEMKIDESNIRRCTTVLVGFSGEQKFTIGDVALPVYAGGINLNVNFAVLDSPSAYNMILGRPWIHKMRVVPSTFHQVVRFPTKWGIKEIRGEQSISRECYRNTLRAKPATL